MSYAIQFEDGQDENFEDVSGEQSAQQVGDQYGLAVRENLCICESRQEAQDMVKMLRPGYEVSVVEIEAA